MIHLIVLTDDWCWTGQWNGIRYWDRCAGNKRLLILFLHPRVHLFSQFLNKVHLLLFLVQLVFQFSYQDLQQCASSTISNRSDDFSD